MPQRLKLRLPEGLKLFYNFRHDVWVVCISRHCVMWTSPLFENLTDLIRWSRRHMNDLECIAVDPNCRYSKCKIKRLLFSPKS